MREELVVRNVARLAELPGWERQQITPWSSAEARRFLSAARGDPLYPAFVLLLIYGLRRGEVLGLRWQDIDFGDGDGEIRIRQQLQRVKGELRLGPIKTKAGRRDLPLLPQAVEVLNLRRTAQEADRQELGQAWQDNGLVHTTKTGRPIEPRNLIRSFRRICANADVRTVKVHHLRHTTATLLKMSRVASAASFGNLRERPWPAALHTARSGDRGSEGSHTTDDLGCQQRLASGLTMMQPFRLHQAPE